MAGVPRVLIVGGSDVDARIELMGLLRDDFDISAVGSSRALGDRFASAGFAFYGYGLTRGANPALDLAACAQLVRLFRRLRPGIVHTFDTKPCVWGRLAARLAGVPAIVGTIPGLGALYCTSGLSARLTRAVYEPLQRMACHGADLTIFQNPDDAEQMARAGIVPRARSNVLRGSGVRTDLYSRERVAAEELASVRKDAQLAGGEVVVCMVSRLLRSKGVLDYATAAAIVRRTCPHVRFLLVGPRDTGSRDCLTAAEADDLGRVVTWLGRRGDVQAVLAASDVFVLPSYYREGIPRVLLEAGAMGLPLITTDAPGCREAVAAGHNGLLIPPRDPQGLAEAIMDLAADPGKRTLYGKASRRKIEEEFDVRLVAEQTASIYRDLLATIG